MKYIDIHTHVNLSAFKDDRDEVISRALGAGVAHINVGTQKNTSTKAVEIARQYESGVYACIGLHPVHTEVADHDEEEIGEGGKPFISREEVFYYDFYRDLATDPKVVAIGECGLDYYHTTLESEKKQRDAFSAQIALANELGKPLMLHIRNGKDSTRNAYLDACEILKSEAKVLGNSHFFAGSLEDAKRFYEMGYSTSFTGVVTFTRDYDEVVRYAPKELLHAETDAPYVTPVPHRGKRNEPIYVIDVIQKLAEIRGEETEKFAQQLLKNARTFFKI